MPERDTATDFEIEINRPVEEWEMPKPEWRVTDYISGEEFVFETSRIGDEGGIYVKKKHTPK